MFIRDLLWDPRNIAHIAAHGVEQDEIEDIAYRQHYARKHRGENRYILLGQTSEGRYLLIVVDRLETNLYYVVTARDMEQDERRQYRHAIHQK